MTGLPENIDQIFWGALQLDTDEERREYLERACGADAEQRRLVEKLLRAQPKAAAFLERPFAPAPATVAGPISEGPGTVIGPYRLLEQIGEGGFGVVFMAEQQEPIRRKVALKVLKPGMDTKDVIARFEAERQALALMDHPNIAKVLDAGQTTSGRPFFVMDLVKGMPTTEYCDQNQLTPRERLELFVHVCQAVQHAHQKGIIHRDLKPSNVLVTLQDGTPLVKVIDFGIAKALGQQLTDKTLFTGFAQLVGTPLYMSPEQAALSNADVDTRSDIYSLGVLLYELLTGTTPFDKERFKVAGYDEIRRIIREEEPPKPSTRLSTLAQAATTTWTRKSETRKLSQLFRGELDWIVMKCLEKDRNRRYETANALAADVRRYLDDQPVEACPPSVWYRFRKFARRNKGTLTTAALVTSALVLTTVVLAVSNVLITQQRDEKDQALTQKDAALAQATANEQAARTQRRLARLAVDRMFTQVAEKWLAHQTGLEPLQRRFLQDALEFYEKLINDRATTHDELLEAGNAYKRMGQIEHKLGQPTKAVRSFAKAQAILNSLVDDSPSEPEFRAALAASYQDQALMLLFDDRFDDAESILHHAVAHRKILVKTFPEFPHYRYELAGSYAALGAAFRCTERVGRSVQACRRCLRLLEDLPSDFVEVPDRFFWCAAMRSACKDCLALLGNSPEVERLFLQAKAAYEKLVTMYPAESIYRNELSWAYKQEAEMLSGPSPSRAEQRLGQALALEERLAAESPSVPDYQFVVAVCCLLRGRLLQRLGKNEEAESAYRKGIATLAKLRRDFPSLRRYTYEHHLGQCQAALGSLLATGNRRAEAEAVLREACTRFEELAQSYRSRRWCRCELADCLNSSADALKVLGCQNEALRVLRESVSVLQELIRDNPEVSAYRTQLALEQEKQAQMIQQIGR
jgi:serine/threonine protein kinase